MEWNSRELGFLAHGSCAVCGGVGAVTDRRGRLRPCRCSLRGMFRECYSRFRICVESGKSLSRVTYDRNPGSTGGRGVWGRKREEYVADFENVARRTLDEPHYRLFRYRYLLGAHPRLCALRLGISRTAAYHAFYRIEAKLGRALAELEPYPLFPTRDYFNKRSPEPVQPLVPPRPAPPPRPWEVIRALPSRYESLPA